MEIPFENFESVYFRVKDKYMEMMNEDMDGIDAYEAIKNDSRANDNQIFGLSKKVAHDLIGYVYYFLISMYNLIETKNDETPIIDVKGNIRGRVNYSVGFEVVDPFTKQSLPLEDYENMTDLIGKKLKVTLDLRRAGDLPEKQCTEVYAKYQWMDEERKEFNTGPVKEKTRTPQWNYHKEHLLNVDDELVNHCMSNTLTIGVYGLLDIPPELKWRRIVENEGDTISQEKFFGSKQDVITSEKVTVIRKINGEEVRHTENNFDAVSKAHTEGTNNLFSAS